MPRKGWSAMPTPEGWYQVLRGPRPKSEVWPRRQQWSSSWSSGGQWHARAQKEQVPVQRRWQRGKSRQDPEEAQVAARHRVERLESALAAVGRVRICRGTESQHSIEGSSSGCTRASFGCASDGMSRFHPAFPESAPADGGGTSGGAKGIGCGTRTFVQVARRNGEEHGSSIGESRTDSARCDPGHRSICRDSAVESEIGRSGVGTRCFSEEASPFPLCSCVRHPSGDSEHQCFGASRVGQTISFDADDDRPGKFFGRIEQPLQFPTVTVPDEQFSDSQQMFEGCPRVEEVMSNRTRYGLRGQRIGEAANPGPSNRRRRTQRRALPWSWDSDSESADERNVAPRMETVESDVVEQVSGRDISLPQRPRIVRDVGS